jgi:predicted Zn-dependent peptidase
MKRTIAILLAAAALAAPSAWGEGFKDLQSQVREYTLPNGLTFLVLERHDAPVFSFVTYVDAGGVNEVPGITGVAHMFEHMAFKGTPTVGTNDFAAESKAMAEVDRIEGELAKERDKGRMADTVRVGELEQEFKAAQAKAKEYVVSNGFSKILEENGVVGLNASTFTDWTQYYYSLPSNRLELWARLEGDRLANPVLREFYSERDVVYEERRFDESSPNGRLFLDWLAAAFVAHPYGVGGVIGIPSDIKNLTREDALAFHKVQYVAPNITVAVVGDVSFAEVKRLADEYFSGVPGGEDPPPVRTVEPRHDFETRVIRDEDAQPVVLVGYNVPGGDDPDWPAVEILGDLIGSGRTSRLYKRLVKEDKIAAQVFAGAGFLGDKYPNVLVVQALVAKDATTDQVETAMYEELDRLAAEGPTAAELAKVKTRRRASFIRGLRSNSGLARQLAENEEKWGDWHKLFGVLGELDAVTTADVQRVAKEALRPGNRTVGIMHRPAAAGQS